MLANTIDMISSTYYLKLSLNKICNNLQEEEIAEIPEILIENIAQIDAFVQQVKGTNPALQKSAPNLLLSGKLPRKDYHIILKQLSDINELINKYELRCWNPLLVKSINTM